jgi:hypothetical protein
VGLRLLFHCYSVRYRSLEFEKGVLVIQSNTNMHRLVMECLRSLTKRHVLPRAPAGLRGQHLQCGLPSGIEPSNIVNTTSGGVCLATVSVYWFTVLAPAAGSIAMTE